MNVEAYFYPLALVQLAWILLAGIWAWRRGDEVPILVSAFLFYIFSFRFWAIFQGITGAVDISNFGFGGLDLESALTVLEFAVLGETVFLGSYMYAQRRRISHGQIAAAPYFVRWLRSAALVLSIICIVLALFGRHYSDSQAGSGKVTAFESSAYIYLLPFSLISVAMLLVIVWKAGGLKDFISRSVAIVVLAAVALLTFGAYARFQFIGWLLACTIIVTSGYSFTRKVLIGGIGIAIAIALFVVAGALRNQEEDSDASLEQNAWERFLFASDANMLDGFALLRQVYPNLLPFDYGGAHLEILTRPIPRALWPDKPVGGYMNKLGLTGIQTGGTLGISPSLFGSFYQEGGLVGIVVCSLLYGVGLGKLIAYTTRIPAITGVLIRGMVCAWLIPLLRGGDLPGIYAWSFMSFWPCFLLLLIRRGDFFAKMPLPATPITSGRPCLFQHAPLRAE